MKSGRKCINGFLFRKCHVLRDWICEQHHFNEICDAAGKETSTSASNRRNVLVEDIFAKRHIVFTELSGTYANLQLHGSVGLHGVFHGSKSFPVLICRWKFETEVKKPRVGAIEESGGIEDGDQYRLKSILSLTKDEIRCLTTTSDERLGRARYENQDRRSTHNCSLLQPSIGRVSRYDQDQDHSTKKTGVVL